MIHHALLLAPISSGPVVNHYPVPTERNPEAGDYFFPIGWAVFLHDFEAGVPGPGGQDDDGEEFDKIGTTFSEKKEIVEDWQEGYLDKIMDQSGPWNIVYAVGRPTAGDKDARTTADDYINFVDEARTPGSGEKSLDVLPTLLFRRHKDLDSTEADGDPAEPWSLVSPISWDDSTNSEINGWVFSSTDVWHKDNYIDLGDSDMWSAVQDVKNKSNLKGWMLSDEPYGGDGARLMDENPFEDSEGRWEWEGTNLFETDPHPWYDDQGNGSDSSSMIRDDAFYRMKEVLLELQTNQDTNDDNPIHTVLRAN